MNQYVTGAVIKELREKNKMPQSQLAEELGVSDKAISKWETAKGYPDITLLEPIADAFRISVTELISGNTKPYDFCRTCGGRVFRQDRSRNEQEPLHFIYCSSITGLLSDCEALSGRRSPGEIFH